MRHIYLFALLATLTLWGTGCDQEPAPDAESDPAAADTASAATTYYLAPDGSDENAGTSAGQPWQTFGHAFVQLAPGDTLVLLDGVYDKEASGYFLADCSAEARSGTEAAPITIRAQNERKAWVKGDGSVMPFQLDNCSWWTVEGLHVSSADNAAGEGGRGSIVKVEGSRHIALRRLLVHHNNRYKNGGGLQINRSQHVLVEESELYNFHRNGFVAFQSNDITYRRCYANSRGHVDLDDPDAYTSHRISQDGGDRSFLAYYGSNLLVENCISENKTEGFGFISGKETAAGRPSGERARFRGIISLHDNTSGAVQSRKMTDTSQPIRDVSFEHFLMAGFQRKGFHTRAAKDLTMRNVTILNGQAGTYHSGKEWDGNVFGLNTDQQRYWPTCETIGGCTFRLSNWLIANNDGQALVDIADRAARDFRMTYSNFYNNGVLGIEEEISDGEGQVQHSMHVEPTEMGMGEGACMVFVPEASNMSGAGKDGTDIGANILYRYQDGKLTDEPLWDPETGEFPHGAVVEGVNDVAGASLVDVHERLNVNAHGCTLPYSP